MVISVEFAMAEPKRNPDRAIPVVNHTTRALRPHPIPLTDQQDREPTGQRGAFVCLVGPSAQRV